MVKKISPFLLQQIFIDSLSNARDFEVIDGLNPFHIKLNGKEMYIYIKNLSSAYFSNTDVWRIQLPIRDDFEEIKGSPLDFVLLGYDGENDVYTAWNPKWAKQRLNIAESVSFYSRYTLQVEAAETEEFKRKSLNNDGEVIAFPRTHLEFLLNNLKVFFKDDSDYVAMGSKKRQEANESYKVFTDPKNIQILEAHMSNNGYSQSAISNYCKLMRVMLNEGLINQYRKLFLAYDTIEEYLKIVSEFCTQPLIKERNERSHNGYSAALRMYIKALCLHYETDSDKYETHPDDDIDIPSTEPEIENIAIDWEQEFTDKSGKLTKIANPELIDKLRPLLDVEYKSLPAALNTITAFYGDKFPNMQFSDWVKLLNAIDWEDPYVKPVHKSTTETTKSKSKTVTLRVIYPDGRVVQHPKATDTYVRIIEENCPDLINELGIVHAGVNIVQRELDSKYEGAQREISGGWYVFTNTNTPKKRLDLIQISDALDLGLQVDLISVTTGEVVEAEDKTSSSRQTIKVTFPDGRVIQHTRVLKTLIEVVIYAGPEKVRGLNIICCADNLILKNPAPRYVQPSKPVGGGWLCNTCSGTPTKYEQILQINKELGLGLKVELV